LKLSLEVAKRFYDFTIRGGLIESKGGAGVDYELLDDKLKFSLEAWDFDREKDKPHLKFSTTYFFYDNLL